MAATKKYDLIWLCSSFFCPQCGFRALVLLPVDVVGCCRLSVLIDAFVSVKCFDASADVPNAQLHIFAKDFKYYSFIHSFDPLYTQSSVIGVCWSSSQFTKRLDKPHKYTLTRTHLPFTLTLTPKGSFGSLIDLNIHVLSSWRKPQSLNPS